MNKRVCQDPGWCNVAWNHNKLNIVIVRFNASDAANSTERAEVARDWLKELDGTFHDMSESVQNLFYDIFFHLVISIWTTIWTK